MYIGRETSRKTYAHVEEKAAMKELSIVIGIRIISGFFLCALLFLYVYAFSKSFVNEAFFFFLLVLLFFIFIFAVIDFLINSSVGRN